MAGVFIGRTSTSALFVTPIAGHINNFSIVNNESSSVTINVYKVANNGIMYRISPANLLLAQNEMYEGTRTTVILATQAIKVQTSGSIDYDFNISK